MKQGTAEYEKGELRPRQRLIDNFPYLKQFSYLVKFTFGDGLDRPINSPNAKDHYT